MSTRDFEAGFKAATELMDEYLEQMKIRLKDHCRTWPGGILETVKTDVSKMKPWMTEEEIERLMCTKP